MEPLENNAYCLTNFDNIKDPIIPPLHEIWNWQGDKSVLPFKWADIIQKARKIEMDQKALVATYIKDPNFDPFGFFFLTQRSNTVGSVLVSKNQNVQPDSPIFEILFLCAQPQNRNAIEEALLSLALQYCKKKACSKTIIVPFDSEQTELVESFGFEKE